MSGLTVEQAEAIALEIACENLIDLVRSLTRAVVVNSWSATHYKAHTMIANLSDDQKQLLANVLGVDRDGRDFTYAAGERNRGK